MIPKDKLKLALSKALKIIDRNMVSFEGHFPGNQTKNSRYPHDGNISWTAGFWPGILYLAYELTGDEKYYSCAEGYIESFYERIDKMIRMGHHDMGFLYSLSCVPAYMLKGNERAKEAALIAAQRLSERFMEKGEFINAWASDMNNIAPNENIYIIDCMMNLPLLYWASKITGNTYYSDIASRHANTCINTIIRSDNSTYHSYLFDLETGEPIKGITQQGFSDSSTWSRGQSWGVYGFALQYNESGEEKYLNSFKRVTDYFVSHLPKDNVPYWDMYFTEGDEPRDSSSAAVAVCGINEMSKSTNSKEMSLYKDIADKMLESLIDNYGADPEMENNDGILLHSTGSVPHGIGVDEPAMYGDYFYMEALTRYLKPCWEKYW